MFYLSIGPSLTSRLPVQTEQRMGMICDGMRSKREVIDESVEEYRDVFTKSRRDFNLIAEVSSRSYM